MLVFFYAFTLFVPLILSFIIDDAGGDADEFFTFFSFNKLMIFVNGIILAQLSGFHLGLGILTGTFQVILYHFGFKLIKGLEYKGAKTIVLPGAKGFAYTSIGTNQPQGRVLIAGETYYAMSANDPIGAFSPIKVVDKLDSILIVEEDFQGGN